MQLRSFCSGLTAFFLVLTCTIKSRAQVVVSSPEQVTANGPGLNIKHAFDEDAFTWYAVYADDKAIYVNAAIKDSMQKRKVLQNGMELWIDVKAKKNKITGIMFPLGEKVNGYPGGGNRNAAGGPPPFLFNRETNNNNADSIFMQQAAGKKQAVLKGFTATADTVNIAAMQGVTVGMYLQHDTLVYNAVIPLSSLNGQALAKGAISVGIVEKGIELPGFGDMGGPGGDDMGGGGPPPGDGGGMMPPPGSGDGDFDMRRLFTTNTIWYKLKLRN